MASVTTKPELSQPTTESNSHLFDGWFDPIETGSVTGFVGSSKR